jgi:hypothetical protein
MSENLNEAVGDMQQEEWRELNEFAIVHQDGRTIARYTVMGKLSDVAISHSAGLRAR